MATAVRPAGRRPPHASRARSPEFSTDSDSGRRSREFLYRICRAKSADYGLRKRKKRCNWSSGTVSSNRPLLVIGISAAGCQFVRLGLVVDSRTKPVDVSGQEVLKVVLMCAAARRAPPESQV